MSIARVRRWRDWVPVPKPDGRVGLVRWVLLEANRLAVTGALLTMVFATLMAVGTVWTFELQKMLVETSTVETILNTFLSGMILLVSIVVSINSIVLSHDITSVEMQEERIRGAMEFRRDLASLTETGETPTDPSSFLAVMSRVITERARTLSEGDEVTAEIRDYATSVAESADQLSKVEHNTGGEFSILWRGLEFDYGPFMDRARALRPASSTADGNSDSFDDLIKAFELFATGKEYFKTLYYAQEVSRLSRTLLVVTLPAILFNASTILAINAELFPQVHVLGLPPLQTFVATAFTISLAPYLVLTSFMLRLSTVAQKTSSGGIFSL